MGIRIIYVNSTINIFSIIPSIIALFCTMFFFIKYMWISKISLALLGLKTIEKKFTLPFNPVFLSYY